MDFDTLCIVPTNEYFAHILADSKTFALLCYCLSYTRAKGISIDNSLITVHEGVLTLSNFLMNLDKNAKTISFIGQKVVQYIHQVIPDFP